MTKGVKGKKLLVLGGGAMSCDIVLTARKMGVYTIVVDWFNDFKRSPAKKLSDENYVISVADIDAVVYLIKNKGIDGVITGFTDSILRYYQEICEKAALPCYATKEHIEIMTDKSRFKMLARQYSVPVVKDYILRGIFSEEELAKLEYPVITKPIDSSGARGIRVAWNRDDFLKSYAYSLEHSLNKKVVVERYMGGVKQLTGVYTHSRWEYKAFCAI